MMYIDHRSLYNLSHHRRDYHARPLAQLHWLRIWTKNATCRASGPGVGGDTRNARARGN